VCSTNKSSGKSELSANKNFGIVILMIFLAKLQIYC
jgi:hypothetical protein